MEYGFLEYITRQSAREKNRYEKWTRMRQVAGLQGLSHEGQKRLEWLIFYHTQGKNIKKTCEHFGISRRVFWKWRKRFDEKTPLTLECQSRAPKTRRQREITPLEEERVVELRRQYIRYGKEKLAIKYEQRYGSKISAWKVQKTIEKYKIYYYPAKNQRTQAKRKKAQQKKRITELRKKRRNGYLFGVDTIVRYWNGRKRYILTAIDSISKVGFAHMYTSHSSQTAADFLHRLKHLSNGHIENVQTDNGSEFHEYFEKACGELEINHYWSRTHTPKDNSVCERFNRTLEEEFIQLGNRIVDPVEFNRKLTEWLIEYNFYRPHHSLNYMVPMYLIQRDKHLLPMYSSDTKA